jgi:hypothetical protein
MTRWQHLDGTRAPDLFLPIGTVSARDSKLQAVGDMPAVPFQDQDCDQRPTVCTKSDNFYTTMDTEVAAQLKITYIGTGSASVDRKMKVFMREFRKYADCELSNGKGTVRYGAVLRATVLIDEDDVKSEVNFPMVAASATLKHHTAQVHISAAGFDPVEQIGIDDAGQKAMAATKGGLNVSTFADFADLLEKAIGLAIKAKVALPLTRIGFEPRQSPELIESVARAFAVSCAAEGRGADDAIAAFPKRDASIEQAIRDVYDKLEAQDPDPSMVRMKAQNLIEGIQVPIKYWYQFWK